MSALMTVAMDSLPELSYFSAQSLKHVQYYIVVKIPSPSKYFSSAGCLANNETSQNFLN